MKKCRKLVIVGAGEFAEIAYEYFSRDSEYEVCAFAVEKQYRTNDSLFDLPVVDFERVADLYPPSRYETYVAITYTQLNRVRKRLYMACKQKGYRCASYVSSHAFVWHNVTIGENTFIFEDNTIQYHAQIGNNVVIWSGNHIGHRSVIEDDAWLTSHVVVSGFCHIGRGSFIGVNATLGDNVVLGNDTVFGAGALTVKSLTEQGKVYVGIPAKPLLKTAYEQFSVSEAEDGIEDSQDSRDK